MHETITLNPILSGNFLDNVKTFTYLGTIFDYKFILKNHVGHFSVRIIKELPILKRLDGYFWRCSRSAIIHSYEKKCRPGITISATFLPKL